jgi:hypothetical protein
MQHRAPSCMLFYLLAGQRTSSRAGRVFKACALRAWAAWRASSLGAVLDARVLQPTILPATQDKENYSTPGKMLLLSRTCMSHFEPTPSDWLLISEIWARRGADSGSCTVAITTGRRNMQVTGLRSGQIAQQARPRGASGHASGAERPGARRPLFPLSCCWLWNRYSVDEIVAVVSS